jgi:hypothetical protein
VRTAQPTGRPAGAASSLTDAGLLFNRSSTRRRVGSGSARKMPSIRRALSGKPAARPVMATQPVSTGLAGSEVKIAGAFPDTTILPNLGAFLGPNQPPRRPEQADT